MKMTLNLRKRFVIIFFGIMLISSFVSALVITVIFYYNHDYNSESKENDIIQNISLLLQTSLNDQDIAKFSSTQEFSVNIIDKNDEYAYLGNGLTDGEYVKLSNGLINKDVIILKSDNMLYKISHIRNNSIHIMFALFVIGGFMLSLIIGTVISGTASKSVLAPILEVIDATKKVAHGDFNVHIPNKKVPEYRELADNFNIMVDELRSVETLRNDFVSSISHEFKTPTASIQGFAQMLKTDNIDAASKKEYLDIIIEETKRLSKLSSNVLLLSKLENQNLILPKQKYDLSEQIRRVILVLEPQWSAKNIDLGIDLDDKAIINGNEELLFQVWLNIIQNAIKFTPENGNISISAKQAGAKTSIVIKDSGIGMDSQTVKHIFDKFYQADRSRKQDGNGLGLSIAYKIIQISNGTLSVNSEINKGTSFLVTL
jgi:signal transduction histidine kinase